jgi:methionyl-tRNA formyltransferase
VRTVYLGTSEFAAGVLGRLAASPHRPQLVVTRPDRRRGRGRRPAAPPVADAARELGIELLAPESVGEASVRATIAAAEPDILCLCAFGALIKPPLLTDYQILNVHPSLLPRWRGAAPIERAIMAGDESTGVSIMRLTEGLDSGPVGRAAEEPIRPADTYGSLAARLQALGGELLISALDHGPAFAEQDETLATYAQKLTAEDRRLDPGRPAAELERIVRALNPHVGATVALADGASLGVWEARVSPSGDSAGAQPGELSLRGPLPVLGCAGGALELVMVQPPGRRAMAGADYLRGLRS